MEKQTIMLRFKPNPILLRKMLPNKSGSFGTFTELRRFSSRFQNNCMEYNLHHVLYNVMQLILTRFDTIYVYIFVK